MNYSIQQFQEKGIEKIENLIINMYPYSKSRLIEDINLLINVFHNQETLDLIKLGVSQIWSQIDTYKYDKFDFLDSFIN